MKILQVATNRKLTPFPISPIGVDSVATALRGRHDVRVMDFACDGAEATLASTCQTWKPDVVGLSIRNIDNVEAESPLGFIPEIERLVDLIRAQSTVRIRPSTQLHAIALGEGQISADDDLLEPRFYLPAEIRIETIAKRVNERARGRRHWVTESGSAEMAQTIKRMYQRGRIGPLWDRLVTA